ncbi:unnamed protein product [Phytomonas sp. Hart1]|nr:unnamed protein product [Phytomonas sp. Hart1]|eukprot:CCW68988.1 unnamed protein product [Phytomonas sp. isolate Hart1]
MAQVDTPVPSEQALQIASIYVGDLDPSVTEPQLVGLFKRFGTILNVRVCRDIITQRSLGYGYVNFNSHDDAKRAIETLNFKRVGERCIRLMWQQRDPALRYSGSGNIFIKNLNQGVDSKALNDLFERFGPILSCKVMEDEQGKSRSYGFVHFKNETAAKDAIATMNGSTESGNAEERALYVANFIRRNARLAALVANFTNVYIKQVLPTVDKALIETFFSKFGGITSATTCRDKNGRVFAFCNFETHDEAVKAIAAMHDNHIEGITAPGETLYVQRAQPRSERLIALRQKYMQGNALGNNLYVRNFDPNFTSENLHELFKEYGEVLSCRVMTNAGGVSRGFGFVSFAAPDQANAALREMNGRMLNGKPLIVNIAQRRDQRYTMLRLQFQQRLHVMMRQLQSRPAALKGSYAEKPPRNPRPGEDWQQPSPQPQQSWDARRAGPIVMRPSPSNPAMTPRNSPGQAPETPPLQPITPDELNAMSVEEKRAALGDRLFIKVYETTPEFAPKITGMFLEMDPMDAYELLVDQKKLTDRVTEALCVLEAHSHTLKPNNKN